MVSNDEKDLPTPQSPPKADPRLHGPHGNPGRPQRAQTPPRKGPSAARDQHPGQAARLTRARGPASFARADRLHHSAEFRFLQRHGARAESGYFVMYAGRIVGDEKSRLGITVSKRVGVAVVRNAIKRRIRELYRLRLRAMLEVGTSVVIIARPGAGQLTSDAIGGELNAMIRTISKRI